MWSTVADTLSPFWPVNLEPTGLQQVAQERQGRSIATNCADTTIPPQRPRHPVLRRWYGAVGVLRYRSRGAVRRKTAGQHGDVAQLEEHLLCKQGVVGSSPIISTTNTPGQRPPAARRPGPSDLVRRFRATNVPLDGSAERSTGRLAAAWTSSSRAAAMA
jgi:hypothetical protein